MLFFHLKFILKKFKHVLSCLNFGCKVSWNVMHFQTKVCCLTITSFNLNFNGYCKKAFQLDLNASSSWLGTLFPIACWFVQQLRKTRLERNIRWKGRRPIIHICHHDFTKYTKMEPWIVLCYFVMCFIWC